MKTLPADSENLMTASITGLFWHSKHSCYVLAEICFWLDDGRAYVRWLEQGTYGWCIAEPKQ